MRVGRLHVARPEWWNRAACAGGDTSPWFPERGQSTRARRICAGCPVLRPCLDQALNDPTLTGIRGGTSDNERDLIRRKRSA